jgi:hypothetical protein
MTALAHKRAAHGYDNRPDIDPDGAAERAERARFRAEDRMKADLTLLARFYPRLYGRALDANRTTSAEEDDLIRQISREFSRDNAVALHRRFERLRSGEGCMHYAVLHWAYIERAGKFEMGELGIRFATRAQRSAWMAKRKSISHAAPQKFGEKLHAAAIEAYANLPLAGAWP